MPLAGRIVDGGRVETATPGETVDMTRWTQDLTGTSPFLVADGTVGLYERGDILIFCRPENDRIENAHDRECIVTLETGDRLLCRVQRDDRPGRFNLLTPRRALRRQVVLVDALVLEGLHPVGWQ